MCLWISTLVKKYHYSFRDAVREPQTPNAVKIPGDVQAAAEEGKWKALSLSISLSNPPPAYVQDIGSVSALGHMDVGTS